MLAVEPSPLTNLKLEVQKLPNAVLYDVAVLVAVAVVRSVRPDVLE